MTAPTLKSPPAFMLYARDLYTQTSDMSGAELGAHLRGLCASWDRGGPLPLDADKRRRMMFVDSADWPDVWAALAGRLWFETPEGWINPALEDYRVHAAEYRAKQAAKGRRSGEARRRPNEPNSNHGSTVARTADPTEREPEPQPETNIPISDLRSTNFSSSAATPHHKPPRKDTRGGSTREARATLPARARAAGYEIPPFLLDEWHGQLRPWNGQHPKTGATVDDFITETLKALEVSPRAGDPRTVWRKAWEDWCTHQEFSPRQTNWFDECSRLHGGACQKQADHAHRLRTEAVAISA